MTQKKYFVGYAYNQGFGNSSFDANRLTKENCKAWIKEVEKHIKKQNPHITERIIILNIQEIK